jgi:hypothetical protein
MPPTAKPRAPAANRLLAALPLNEYQRLLPELEQVTMPFAEVLYEPGERIRHVYFPNESVVSLLAEVTAHSPLEVGLIGNEGVAGISVFMGVDTSPYRAIVQGVGTAMRMKAAVLRKEAEIKTRRTTTARSYRSGWRSWSAASRSSASARRPRPS